MEKLRKIDLKVEIRRNEDGTIATDVWKDWEYSAAWWQAGNASCDCNREVFFCRALGLDESDEIECGRSKYSVRLTDNNSGIMLYSEF